MLPKVAKKMILLTGLRNLAEKINVVITNIQPRSERTAAIRKVSAISDCWSLVSDMIAPPFAGHPVLEVIDKSEGQVQREKTNSKDNEALYFTRIHWPRVVGMPGKDW
jgi:hypothetical protein